MLCYFFCYFIAEKYFFDKFFYYKSTKYGYYLPGKNSDLKDFGERARDLITLKLGQPIQPKNNVYKVAVIGDSYVWGQGVKNGERFSPLLQNKLNQVRPTKVYSLGGCGDNIFDNYIKYKKSIDVFGDMDLYIFAMVNNDLVFNRSNYHGSVPQFDDIFQSCNGTAQYTLQSGLSQSAEDQVRTLSLAPNSKNFCAYKKIVELLPKDNAIYVDLSSLSEDSDYQKTFSNLIKQDLNALILPHQLDPQKYTVSPHDGHPSVLAHQFIAKTIYQEIITNQKWRFKK